MGRRKLLPLERTKWLTCKSPAMCQLAPSMDRENLRLALGKTKNDNLSFGMDTLFTHPGLIDETALLECKMMLEKHGVVAITGIMRPHSWDSADLVDTEVHRPPLLSKLDMYDHLFLRDMRLQEDTTQRRVVQFLSSHTALSVLLMRMTLGSAGMLGQSTVQHATKDLCQSKGLMHLSTGMCKEEYGAMLVQGGDRKVRFVPNSHTRAVQGALFQSPNFSWPYVKGQNHAIADLDTIRFLRRRTLVFPSNSLIIWKPGMVKEDYCPKKTLLQEKTFLRIILKIRPIETVPVPVRRRLAYLAEMGLGPHPNQAHCPSMLPRWSTEHRVLSRGDWETTLLTLDHTKQLLYGLLTS